MSITTYDEELRAVGEAEAGQTFDLPVGQITRISSAPWKSEREMGEQFVGAFSTEDHVLILPCHGPLVGGGTMAVPSSAAMAANSWMTLLRRVLSQARQI